MALADGRYVPSRTVHDVTIRRYQQRRLARARLGSRSRAKKRADLARVRRREAERARAVDFRLAHGPRCFLRRRRRREPYHCGRPMARVSSLLTIIENTHSRSVKFPFTLLRGPDV